MSLSTNSLINQYLTNNKAVEATNNPYNVILTSNFNFPHSLSGTIPINTFGDWNYTGGTIDYLKFNYIIRATSGKWNTTQTYTHCRAFDSNTSTYWLSSNANYLTYYFDKLQGVNYTSSPYVAGTGVYQGGGHATRYYTTAGHSGEYFHMEFQFKFNLKSFKLVPLNTASNTKFPQDIAVLGSQNGTTWTLIGEYSATNVLFPNGVTFNVSTVKRFSYFRFVYKSLYGGHMIYISSFEMIGDTYDLLADE